MVLLVGDQVSETMLIAKQLVQLPPKMLALVMQQWVNSITNLSDYHKKLFTYFELKIFKNCQKGNTFTERLQDIAMSKMSLKLLPERYSEILKSISPQQVDPT